MKQQDKELLLKDLCARLPYGVKIKHITQRADACQAEVSFTERLGVYTLKVMMEFKNEDFPFFLNKPYLFPLSSMTEKQKKELRRMNAIVGVHNDIFFATCDEYGHDISITHEDAIRITRWLNENHFDYRGLIPKGLAIDATGLNVY